MLKNSLNEQVSYLAKKFLEERDGEVSVISHFDTDGISSAAIITKTFGKLDIPFSLKIVKNLEEQFIYDLPKDKTILFLDLASNSLGYIKDSGLKKVFIIDHHETHQEIPPQVEILNPQLHKKEKISSSGLVYLFCRELDESSKKYAKLAILGMVGDQLEKDIERLNNNILEDGEIKRKKGLLIYPSTRPLNRVLEYCSSPFIPGVTGNSAGVLELLREANLVPKSGKYKSIIELDGEEMEKLTTAIMLRNPRAKYKNVVGEIFLIKLFNKLEDAREISAIVNACSRFGDSATALQFLMESSWAKQKAEAIHIKYKQYLVSALKFVSETKKIIGPGFVIINAKDKIKDTMAGTVTSILANSSLYEDGTVIITLASDEDKIKISARTVGRKGRNAREVLANVIEKTGGEVGGHEFAAGAIMSQEKEAEFLNLIKKSFEIEIIKV